MSYYLLSQFSKDLLDARKDKTRLENELNALFLKARGIRTMTIWDQLRHFNKDERWGDPDKMKGYALLGIDAIRHIVDSRFIILCGYELIRETGEHPNGIAIDGYCPDLSPKDMYLKMNNAFNVLQLSEFIGFGIYPQLRPTCGWHIDFRGTHARWGAIKTMRDLNGKFIKHVYGTINQAAEMI